MTTAVMTRKASAKTTRATEEREPKLNLTSKYKRRHPRDWVKDALPRPGQVQRHWAAIDASWDYSRPQHVKTSVPTEDILPDPFKWSRALALATVETMSGQRYPTQLERWLTPELYKAVERRVLLCERLDGPAGRSIRARVLSSRVCNVSDAVAETVHVISQGSKVRAVSVRLEARRRQWMATALEII